MLSLIVLSGCDTINLSMTEDSYQQAIESGELQQQIHLIDELYQYAPEKYQLALDEKEYLLPLLEQLIANPRNFSGLSESDLERAFAFAPNYEPFSLAKKYLSKQQAIKAKIRESEAAALTAKKHLQEKLIQTPKHIETYNTGMSFRGFERYFLASIYTRKFIDTFEDKQLNGYQLAAITKGLADIFVANQVKEKSLLELDLKALDKLNENDREFIKENGDIQRVLMWLYKKQLVLSYKSAEKSNDYLQSLLNSKYGRERLDDVWLRLVEPAAKKSVMQAKETYLSALDLIAAKIDKTAGDKPKLKKIYSETLALDKKLLSLMWPPNGLDNFKESSKQAMRELKVAINEIQQR